MKKHKLPDKDEWEKIIDEAFSSDEIHTFSEKYNLKKYQDYPIRKGIAMKKNNLLMNLTVVATALAVVAIPTGIYIAGNMTSTKSSTQYANEEQAKNEPASPVANDTIYNIEFGWLPEDFEYNNEESYTYFTNDGNKKIFMIASFIKNLSGEKTENGKSLTVRDEYDTDDKTIDIRYQDNYVENSTDKDCTNYGRVATIYFKDTPYELELLVTDDVTKEDFAKIIENVRLVPSDTEIADIYQGETVTATEMTITDGNDDGQVNEDIHEFKESDNKPAENYDDTIYSLEYGWLPEGLEYQNEDSPYGRKFHNWTTNDGMTPVFSKVPEGVTYYEDTGNPEIETTKEEWLLDGKTVSMYHRSTYIANNPELNFGRIAFIYFDNTPYVLQLYVTDGISEEDFKKIIDNVKLVPSEEETAGIYTPRQNEQENIDFEVGSYENMGILVEESDIVQIGEEVYEKNPDVWGNISAKVTGVRFDDDFNGLTTDQIGNPADFSQYLHSDGKLIENVRQFYTNKNGKSETIYFDDTTVSVMTVSVTYTNNGTTPTGFGGYCIFPTLQTAYGGYFFDPYTYNVMEVEAMLEETMVGYTDNYDHMSFGGEFSFSSPNQEGKNEIHLDAGESTEVTLAFIVEDKFRDNLYLSMNNNGFVDLSNLE